MSDSPQLLPVADLPPDHLAPVKQAISRLFSSDLGFITFAQIADGCPIQSTYQEYYGHFRADFENNREPSPDAKRVIRELQQTFLVEDLQLEANVDKPFLHLFPRTAPEIGY
ncbi:hypothetical protein N7462_005735 [Penicillium macrosclerotiorum]|uniref:uncharacterized protein n=1 Tax=Penicillium macrosclerotiorum TaxID=303699 RepID=UPI002548A522|nr:uncharacterized protein N7462_005735 [Penicillium macrosclerotiorum]KAJ5682570.1 hypothetical protein N7462_005735 [Penicillium macrosclerotiorum]